MNYPVEWTAVVCLDASLAYKPFHYPSLYLTYLNNQVRLVVKHVSKEELAKIPGAADDLFLIGGRDAFEKRQLEQQQQLEVVYYMYTAYIQLTDMRG